MRTIRFAFALLMACAVTAPAFAGAERSAKDWDSYGALVSKGRFQRVAAVKAPTPDGKTMRLEATIAEVCQMKGCWMNVAGGEDTLRVEFKDYGFFVPSTAAGKPVQMEGVVIEREMSEAEREHLQAESQSGKPIPERMLVFVASGVRIQGGGPIPADQQKRIGGKKAEADTETVEPKQGE